MNPIRLLFWTLYTYGLILFFLISLSSCGKTIPKDGMPGANGVNGTNGSNGVDGVSGHNALIESTPAVSCTNGGQMFLMGTDLNDDNVLQVSEVLSQSTICNGLNGINGTNGQDAVASPFTPVALLNPCGDAPGIYDEVFLKLFNNTIIASFSENVNGKNTRFSILVPGTYQTTDGDNCTFTINAVGVFTYESHHY